MYKMVFRFYENDDSGGFEYVGRKTVENVKKEEIEAKKEEILREFGGFYTEINVYDEKGNLVPFGEV